MRGIRLGLAGAAMLLLAGCAGPVILGINLGTASTVGSLASTAFTGKGLGEHALSAVTEKDCRIIEGIVRKEREICEEPGSPATKDDFRGLSALLEEKEPAAETMVAEAPEPAAPPPAPGPVALEELDAGMAQAGLAPVAAEVAAGDIAPAAIEVAALDIAPAAGGAAAALPAAPRLASAPPPVRSAAAPPSPLAKPAAETGAYSVRIATFRSRAAAEALVRRLRADGYAPVIARLRGGGRGGFVAVQITGFGTASAAERAADSIARDYETGPALLLTKA